MIQTKKAAAIAERDMVIIDGCLLSPHQMTGLDGVIIQSLKVWLDSYCSPIASHRDYYKGLNL